MTNPYKGKFEVCLRGIIENNGRILVCHSKKKDYYYLPGGHLEYGEKIKRRSGARVEGRVRRVFWINFLLSARLIIFLLKTERITTK